MGSKFKEGDIVYCVCDINSSGGKMYLTVGNRYKIIKTISDNSVSLINDKGTGNIYSDCWFTLDDKLAKEIEKRKEELKLKNMSMDPYGEEDWLGESFSDMYRKNEPDYDVKELKRDLKKYGIDILKRTFFAADDKELIIPVKKFLHDKGFDIDPHNMVKRVFNYQNDIDVFGYDKGQELFTRWCGLQTSLYRGRYYDYLITLTDFVDIITDLYGFNLEEYNKEKERSPIHKDVDPYDEEEWDDDYPTNVRESKLYEEIKFKESKVSFVVKRIEDTYGGYTIDPKDIVTLNKYYTGWVKITPDLETYIMYANRWKESHSMLLLSYDRYVFNGQISPVSHGERGDYSMSSNKIKIIKYEELEPVRKFTEDDPYGEEDWEMNESEKSKDFKVSSKIICKKTLKANFGNCFTRGKEYVITGYSIKDKKFFVDGNNEVSFQFNLDEMREYFTNNPLPRVFNPNDPYGEEDWDMNESMYDDYQVGKEYIYVGILDDRVGQKVKLLRIIDDRSPSDNAGHPFYVEFEDKDRMYVAKTSIQKGQKIERPEIDPYGEENWGYTNERKIPYKKILCPDLWEEETINERIKNKLVKIAKDFFNDVELETDIKDIHLTGSMANYNYTDESDIDVHIVIDFKDVNEDIDLVKKAVDGQRFIWNLRHNIVIKGHDVEIYIQDETEEHTSAGLYSLLNDKWIKKPVYDPPDVDTKDINPKYDARVYDILKYDKLSKQNLTPEEAEEYYEASSDLKSKIMKSRKEGLIEEGEFSIENLVFKKLRKEGKIKKLIDTITAFYDKIYSQE